MKNRIFIWFTMSTAFFVPQFIMCQALNLGTVSNFAMFTANGAFDNLGATVINGDIGTNVGAFTGFPPGVLTGSTYTADPVTAQAAIDVNVAYNLLLATPCDTVIGILLGNGQILPPKVYCLGAAATIAGDLILDGQGDPNSIFIIQIDGALSTDNFSRVLLMDSAVWCNVYWQVNGAFIAGNSAVFRGTMINNGAITMLESSDMIGRGLSIAGPIDLHNNTVTIDCSSLFPLPIELASLTVQCKNRNAQINWSTYTETNNDFFSIQRSADAIHWENAGTMKGAGNSNVLINYTFTDMFPFNMDSYYRLVQTDFDGQSKYSDIILYKNCVQGEGALDIYPNPTPGPLNITVEGVINELTTLSIFHTSGRLIYQSTTLPTMIDLSDQQAGMYFISVQLASEIITQKFMIKK